VLRAKTSRSSFECELPESDIFAQRWAYLLIHVVLRDAVALMAGGSFLSDNTTLSPSEKLAERQLRPHAFIVRRTPTSHVFFDTCV
jgi:hypothetical protein